MSPEENKEMKALSSSIPGFENILKDIRASYKIESQILEKNNKYTKPNFGALFRRIVFNRCPVGFDKNTWLKIISWRTNQDKDHSKTASDKVVIEVQKTYRKIKRRVKRTFFTTNPEVVQGKFF